MIPSLKGGKGWGGSKIVGDPEQPQAVEGKIEGIITLSRQGRGNRGAVTVRFFALCPCGSFVFDFLFSNVWGGVEWNFEGWERRSAEFPSFEWEW